MKTYYRENHSRHLWSLKSDDDKKEWKVDYVQIGTCLETKGSLDLMFSFIAWLIEQGKISLPPAEFYPISIHTGYSGCRDFYATKPVKIWYDVIPETNIIRECRGKKERVNLLYSSMNDKVNSGLTITPDTFWTVLQIYLQYFTMAISEDEGSLLEQTQKWWRCKDYENREFEEIQDQGVTEHTSYMGEIKFAPDNSFFLWNNKKVDIGYPYDHFFSDEEQNITKDLILNFEGVFEARNISLNWLDEGMLFIDNSKTDWIIVDKNGREGSPVENYPFFYVPDKFAKPEQFQIYFCTKDKVMCLQNLGFWTQFDDNFTDRFDEADLEKMIATLNEKMMREVIRLYKTERGSFPIEDINEPCIKICIRDKSLPESIEIPIGCQTVIYYPKTKELHWQDYKIKVDGEPIDFEPGDFNLIMNHKKKVTEALKKYDLRWIEFDGAIKFESIEIPF